MDGIALVRKIIIGTNSISWFLYHHDNFTFRLIVLHILVGFGYLIEFKDFINIQFDCPFRNIIDKFLE